MKLFNRTECQESAREVTPLLRVIDDLRIQNRELHDRILALTAPVAMQQVGSQRLAEMEVRTFRLPGSEAKPSTDKPELPGTQVGETVEPMIDTSKE